MKQAIDLRLTRTVTLILILTFVVLQLSSVNGQMMNQFTFLRTPRDYNSQTGAFTLHEQAYSGNGIQSGRLCLAYDYFEFNATAGQALQGQVNSPGQAIYYAFISSSQYRTFNSYAQNCNLKLNSPPQHFNSQTSLTWTPPEDGQYVLVFFTRVYYAGPVYFTINAGAI